MPANILKMQLSLPSFIYISLTNNPNQSGTAQGRGTLLRILNRTISPRQTKQEIFLIIHLLDYQNLVTLPKMKKLWEKIHRYH